MRSPCKKILFSLRFKKMKKPCKKKVDVFWDINRCPLPNGFDARQVSPCIKRLSKKLGYSGPLTITAVGNLDVPHHILRALSSTGIILNHTVSRNIDINVALLGWFARNDPPANVMVISTLPRFSPGLRMLSNNGFNFIYPFSDVSPPDNSLWSNLGTLEEKEDKCSQTGTWKCTVCHNLAAGLGAKSLIRHFSSPQHAQNLQYLLPRGVCRVCSEHYLDAHEEEE